MTSSIKFFFFLFCKVLSNFNPQLEFEAFLRTKGQTAGGAKELWTKMLSAEKKFGPFVQTEAFSRVMLRHQCFAHT